MTYQYLAVVQERPLELLPLRLSRYTLTLRWRHAHPFRESRVMAELEEEEKDVLSHRGRAFGSLEPAIEKLLSRDSG